MHHQENNVLLSIILFYSFTFCQGYITNGHNEGSGYITNKRLENGSAPNIWNGWNATIGDIPYQAAIIESGSDRIRCGGAIVTIRHVITAAHCLFTWDTLDSFYVKAGMVEPVDNKGIIRWPQWFKRSTQYKSQAMKHDIGLIKVKYNYYFDHKKIAPIRLSMSPVRLGEVCFASGWGSNDDENEKMSQILQITKLTVVSCPTDLHRTLEDGFCAAWPGAACRGDSGGPVTQRGELVGIIKGSTSKYSKCGFPSYITGILTNLDFLMDAENDFQYYLSQTKF